VLNTLLQALSPILASYPTSLQLLPQVFSSLLHW